MLFRRLVVWNSTILVFLTAVFVWYNLTSTQKIVEEEVYNSFYTSMDTGAAELASVFRDARNLTLELCANTSVQRALRQDDAAWQDEEQKIQAARQSSENLTILQKSSFGVRVLSHSVRLDGPKPFGNISFKV